MTEILSWLIQRYKVHPSGVLHIGANDGREAEFYSSLGLRVLWIEGDPDIFRELERNISHFKNQRAFLCLASDTDGRNVPFHIASNAGGSSSVLTPDAGLIAREWPGLKHERSIQLTTRRLDAFFNENGIDLTHVNIINADVQGYELPALRGIGVAIRSFDAVIAELNWAPMYHGATKPYELESYLVGKGFVRAWLGMGYPQSTGVWIRSHANPLLRLYMLTSARLWYAAAQCGLARGLQSTGVLSWCRKLYCICKRRGA